MLFRALAALGHSVADVREMYLWQCASFLGVDGRKPIILGTRSLVLPDDENADGGPAAPTISPEREAEAKARFDARARAAAAAREDKA